MNKRSTKKRRSTLRNMKKLKWEDEMPHKSIRISKQKVEADRDYKLKFKSDKYYYYIKK